MGGLGSPVALYLSSAGVGQLTIVDFDTVDLSNLQRQIIHGSEDIGRPKVESARDRLHSINPECRINIINDRPDPEKLSTLVSGCDIVLECSDNFESRFLLNKACHQQGKPLISAAVIRMEGQLASFIPGPDEPCYACLYREQGDDENRCSETGVLAPVAGMMGCMQATEALKHLAGLAVKSGHLYIVDAERMQFRELNLKKDPDCPVCGQA
jgi:molybdopterin-synthase adenylyltransferase